ncbi:MAG: ribonuclease PH [bacterium]|nr:ribonuclease PH [bacterium]
MNKNHPTARALGRSAAELRPVKITLDAMKFADGSALIETGDTQVLVAATLENRVPPFLEGSGSGWITAEYAMLPRATSRRSAREVKRGRQSGRSAEIQRLIGRSLRAAFDLRAMPETTLILDCDVLQADGGTRTASITGAFVAAVRALGEAFLRGDLKRWPVLDNVAATSVGIFGGELLLDLDASEDQQAEVDMNVVGTGAGALVEVQGTGERGTFSRAQFDSLLDLAVVGIQTLVERQQSALAPVLEQVAALERKGPRREAAPKDEKELWGRP